MSKNKRKNLIIDRNFQFKTILFVNILCFLAFSFYPVFIYALTSQMASQQLIDPNFQNIFFKKTLLYFLSFQALFQAFVSMALLFYTHKIAGPIYRTISFLYEIINGNHEASHQFRENDFFTQLSIPLLELKKKEIKNQESVQNIIEEIEQLSDKDTPAKEDLLTIKDKLLELR